MIEIVQADITTLRVDAIVNAANEPLAGGGGVDGAIHRAAGPELMAACQELPADARGVRCPTGEAVRTPGFRLPARYVIHTVGPVWNDGRHSEAELLERAYASSFARALEEPSIRTIAFPSISTGVYHFPKDAAARIAVRVMRRHEDRFDRIVACVFDGTAERLYRQALAEGRA